MKSLFLTTILFLSSYSLTAQYFQQNVDYTIKVKLDDEKHQLNGNISIVYTNNSSQTLNELYFHLWPNAYENKKSALAEQMKEDGERILEFPKKGETGKISNLSFKQEGDSLGWSYTEEPDVALLKLNQALLPGGKTTISTPFLVDIPSGKISRLGHIGQQYQITQWYPKPAVYDQNGWNAMPYLNQGEFYSEFGTFDVEITLPKNYVVGATGNIENADEIEWLKTLAKDTSKTSKEDEKFPESSSEWKTLKYSAENVHDFAWFCDKRYRVKKSEIVLPHSKRAVTTWAMYSPAGGETWDRATDYLDHAIFYYSLWNGDYKYDQMTAVEGALSAGAGMEYPNVTVIGSESSDLLLEQVIMHETGHQWFYGMLGSNERLHPWMDEGMNTYCEIRYMETKYPDGGFDIPERLAKPFQLENFTHYSYHQLLYELSAKRNDDQPIEYHSRDYSSLNYGAVVYSKTGLMIRYLQEYLGKERMDKCLQDYFEKWSLKHPQPKDLIESFESSAGEDLSWFFDSFQNVEKLDYKLKSVKKKDGAISLRLKAKGGLDFPVQVALMKDNAVVQSVWSRDSTITFSSEGTSIKIDPMGRTPDVYPRNNQIKTKGLFKKLESPKLKLLGSLDDQDKTELYHLPLYGYNSADGNMLGWSLYNRALLRKKVEWIVAPMYALHSNRLVGLANLKTFISPNTGFIKEIELRLNLRRFSWSGASPLIVDQEFVTQDYIRFAPELRFQHGLTTRKSNWRYSTAVQYVFLFNSVLADQVLFKEASDHFVRFGHEMKRDKGRLKQSLILRSNAADGLLNTDVTYTHNVTYNRKGKKIRNRLFVGNTWLNERGRFYDYTLGGQNGNYDYSFRNLLMDRAGVSSFWSRQNQFNHGGAKADFGGLSSAAFVAGLNVEADIPIKLGLGVFADVVSADVNNIYADAGIYLRLIPEICTIYVPLIYRNGSTDIWDSPGFNQIRFTLQLNRLNPFELIDNIEI